MSIPTTFIDWVKNELRAYGARYPSISSDRHAFAAWALSYVHELDEDDAFNQTDTLEVGDGGCDGYHANIEEERFYLLQAKYPDDPLGAPIGNEPIQELQHAYAALLHPEQIEHRSRKLAQIGQKLCDAIAAGSKVVLQCITFGRLSDPATREMQAAESSLSNGAVFELIDLDYLYRIHLARETEDDLEGEVIKFKLYSSIAIPLAAPSGIQGIREALTCNLDAQDLAKKISELTPRIFDKNVRFHLGRRNPVNSEIRNLLEEDDQRPAFWYYNNGLTIVCDEFEYIPSSGEIAITNPQIVNGCQTATALAEKRQYFRALGQSFPVGTKVTCISDDSAGHEQLLKIAENTNSQSPVKAADLKSNQKNQMELQISFANLRPQPWFYERKRGEWTSLPPNEKQRFGDSRINMITVGQRWRAFAGDPAASVSSKEQMFTTDIYGEIYDPIRHPNLFLLAHFLHEEFGNLLSAAGEERRLRLAGTDFDTRYLPRILRSKNLAIAHLVCLAKRLVEKIYGPLEYVNAGALTGVLLTNPEKFDAIWKQVFVVFKIWLDSLGEAEDLRAGLKRADSIEKMTLKLNDHVLALPGWHVYELPLALHPPV